jgi:hypothetical protein
MDCVCYNFLLSFLNLPFLQNLVNPIVELLADSANDNFRVFRILNSFVYFREPEVALATYKKLESPDSSIAIT